MLVRVPVLSHLEFDIIWEQLGLGERPLDQRVEDLLTMLVRNQFTVDGLVLAAGREPRVLAAGYGSSGLLAVHTDDALRLEPVRGTNLVGPVVALLPEEKPGPGSAVTLPRAVFSAATEAYSDDGYFAFERALNQGGITGRDLRILSTGTTPTPAATSRTPNAAGTARSGSRSHRANRPASSDDWVSWWLR